MIAVPFEVFLMLMSVIVLPFVVPQINNRSALVDRSECLFI